MAMDEDETFSTFEPNEALQWSQQVFGNCVIQRKILNFLPQKTLVTHRIICKYWNEQFLQELYRRRLKHPQAPVQRIRDLRVLLNEPSSQLVPQLLCRHVLVFYEDIIASWTAGELCHQLLTRWGHLIHKLNLSFTKTLEMNREHLKREARRYPLSFTVHTFLSFTCPNVTELAITNFQNNEYNALIQGHNQIAFIVRGLGRLHTLSFNGNSTLFREFFQDLQNPKFAGIGRRLKTVQHTYSYTGLNSLQLYFEEEYFPNIETLELFEIILGRLPLSPLTPMTSVKHLNLGVELIPINDSFDIALEDFDEIYLNFPNLESLNVELNHTLDDLLANCDIRDMFYNALHRVGVGPRRNITTLSLSNAEIFCLYTVESIVEMFPNLESLYIQTELEEVYWLHQIPMCRLSLTNIMDTLSHLVHLKRLTIVKITNPTEVMEGMQKVERFTELNQLKIHNLSLEDFDLVEPVMSLEQVMQCVETCFEFAERKRLNYFKVTKSPIIFANHFCRGRFSYYY